MHYCRATTTTTKLNKNIYFSMKEKTMRHYLAEKKLFSIGFFLLGKLFKPRRGGGGGSSRKSFGLPIKVSTHCYRMSDFKKVFLNFTLSKYINLTKIYIFRPHLRQIVFYPNQNDSPGGMSVTRQYSYWIFFFFLPRPNTGGHEITLYAIPSLSITFFPLSPGKQTYVTKTVILGSVSRLI